jgi:hypothetical protein
MDKFKLYFGSILSINYPFFLIGFLRIHYDFFYHPFLALIGWLSGVILFFWMINNIVSNKTIKLKSLWILSFFIMFVGVIFYFWFIYRKNLLNKIKEHKLKK